MGAGRKQAMRRASRRAQAADRSSARARFRAKYPWIYQDRISKPANPAITALGAVIAIAFIILIDVMLLSGQIEIARVMTTGRVAQATVTAVSCSRGAKSSTGDVTVTFTDLSGNTNTVHHSSDTFNCFDQYHAGDIITIRYAPSDPTKLLTQAEIDSLPWAFVGYGLADVLFVISPAVLLALGLWIRVARG